MAGAIAVGIAVAISSFSVVRAEHYNPDKKKTDFKCSSGVACLTASSTGTNTWGIYVKGQTIDAIHAETTSTTGDSGVAGLSLGTSGNGHGVYGSSTNGDGVYGVTNANASSTTGVYGAATADGYGVYAESNDTSGLYYSLVAQANASNTNIFLGVNNSSGDNCAMDSKADLTCTGKISGSVVQMRQPNSSGRHVLSYASQSASATIEDVGTARMYDGVANVQISSDFASVMDHTWYYVFLTPLGDTRGLYVSRKTVSGFQIRETARGRDSLEFDYRIVAHPLDASTDRLPAAPSMKKLAELPSRTH
jgi:hypothetical protein